MPSIYIDSHAHLTGPDLTHEVHGMLSRAQNVGVKAIMNICTDIETLESGLKLAQEYPWVYNIAATTPHDVEKEGEEVFPVIVKHAKLGDLVAIGETGLDYHYAHSSPDIQKKFLKRYLHLALECQLPIVIHCRDAFADFFEIIDAEYMVNRKHAKGVLHCFTGTMAEAEQLLERGWFISFSGIVTFKKSEALREVVKHVPLTQLLIETDTPYLAPQSQRGKTNEPSFVLETAAVIASVKGVPVEDVAHASTQNAQELFNVM